MLEWWNGIHARLKIVCRKAYGFKSHLQHHMKKSKPKILAIVGPTASGKTSLSITLAKKFNGEIVSADSRQVYRGLDLGTGKVTHEEMQGVPHHLLDVADSRDVYTVVDFVRDGRTAIQNILSRNHLPIIVGGTFFYSDALLGRVTTPEVSPNTPLRTHLDTLGLDELNTLLKEKDPLRAKTIDTKNKRKLIRALEIVDTLGAVPTSNANELYDTLTIGITISREILKENIHIRLTNRLKKGMVAEVQELHKNGLSYTRMHDLGIEYRYIAKYLHGEISEEEMQIQIETKSLQYAKRQMTWLKRDTSIRWFEPHDILAISNEVRAFYKQ